MTMTRQQFKQHYLAGFCGYSNEDLINSGTYELVAETLGMIKSFCHDNHWDLLAVGGYTNTGINKILRQVCTELDIPLAGITTSKCFDYPCWDNVDYLEIVGTNWGDESSTFIEPLDILVRIDGGIQSHTECKSASIDKGKQVIEYDYVDGEFVLS